MIKIQKVKRKRIKKRKKPVVNPAKTPQNTYIPLDKIRNDPKPAQIRLS